MVLLNFRFHVQSPRVSRQGKVVVVVKPWTIFLSKSPSEVWNNFLWNCSEGLLRLCVLSISWHRNLPPSLTSNGWVRCPSLRRTIVWVYPQVQSPLIVCDKSLCHSRKGTGSPYFMLSRCDAKMKRYCTSPFNPWVLRWLPCQNYSIKLPVKDFYPINILTLTHHCVPSHFIGVFCRTQRKGHSS